MTRLSGLGAFMRSALLNFYKQAVIEHPAISLFVILLAVAFFAVYAPNFKLDASSESIVLENDQDLSYYRATRETYGSDDFLIITYSPHDDLLSESSLAGIKSIRDALKQLPNAQSVLTILDVPLVNSPKVPISDLTSSDEIQTLETPGVDKELARKELLESPLYENNLVSPDGRTTAVQVTFKRDERYAALLKQRNDLRDQRRTSGLAPDKAAELQRVTQAFQDYHAKIIERERQDVERVRAIMDQHRDKAKLHLGGVRMITTDMISFIQHDITVFGLGVVLFLILALAYFFKKLRWVLLPMTGCLISVSVMTGYLGYWDWPVTVISSNFISLLLIITMSLTIHLIVRYRLLAEQHPTADQRTLVFDTMTSMAKPSFYTAITTIVAFCSLIVSDIRPVIDFGWMMTIGIAFAFILSFVYFPAVLTFLKPERVRHEGDKARSLTLGVAAFTLKHLKGIVWGCAVLAALGVAGIVQLQVENRFIDHFKSTTEIYRGMELIDKELGGTIPLDFVLDADPDLLAALESAETATDPFDDPFADPEQMTEVTYWFNNDMLTKIEAIHDYLESLPEVGKVLSIATGIKVFKQLNDGRMPEDYELALLRKYVPEKVKQVLIDPYLSIDGNQTRLTMRLIESAPTLKRKELIDKIRIYLANDNELPESTVHPTGMAVLYNNLLQSLYRSQILTLGLVFLSIMAMFAVLFRGVLISILAIIPNLLAAGLVLGLMGWVGIPLDMMTITIAAITIGIGVDDTIHYVHRFKEEFPKYRNYVETVKACHGSIGMAMYYTSLTITAGFSILALSSFIPTIYFGLLTGFAMIAALISNLTLLPALIVLMKPLGQET